MIVQSPEFFGYGLKINDFISKNFSEQTTYEPLSHSLLFQSLFKTSKFSHDGNQPKSLDTKTAQAQPLCG